MKIRPVGAELFHAEDRQTDRQTDGRKDGPTDMTKLIVTFLDFANATKTLTSLLKWRKDEIHTKFVSFIYHLE
jgi:hypothetical protein